MDASERPACERAADPDRHGRRELRGSPGRRARRRRAAAQEPEHGAPAHGLGRAAHGHRARGRRAAACARGGGPAGPGRSASSARPTTRVPGCSSRCRGSFRSSSSAAAARRRRRSPGSPPRTGCARSPTPRAAACSTSTLTRRPSGRSRSRRPASTGSASATGSTSAWSTAVPPGSSPTSSPFARAARIRVRGDVDGAEPLDRPVGHEWANDPDPGQVTVVPRDSLEEAVRIANEETSGLAAGIVTEDPVRRAAFPRRLPRHAGVLARDDPVHGRLRAHGRARDRDQRRLDARAREGRSRTATCGCASTGSSATARRRGEAAGRRQARVDPRGRPGRPRTAAVLLARGPARSRASSAAARRSASSRPARSRSACPGSGSSRGRARCRRSRPRPRSGRRGCSAPGTTPSPRDGLTAPRSC